MRLLSLNIKSDFRNLKGLNLRFDNTTTVIIGNNGTGKSNILEALSNIFAVLYDPSNNEFLFDFVLRYEIDDFIYRIQRKTVEENGVSTVKVIYQKNDVDVEFADMAIPNRIVCNYSGEDLRMWEDYYKKPYDEYMDSIRSTSTTTKLSMVYVDRSKWQYILLCMLVGRDDNTAFDTFLSEKLKITSDSNIKIEIQFKEDILRSWTVQNQITVFIDQLRSTLGESLSSTNVLDFNPNGDDLRELYNKYVGASAAIKTLNVFFNDGIESAFLSEGEKKMMVILFILESIADERTLVLMDEPDSHVHISRKEDICDMFCHLENRCNIITSHSPTLTTFFEQSAKDAIIALDNDGKIIDKEKYNIVRVLTDDIWTSQKRNLFLTSCDDILIVEGPSDARFISTALRYFKNNGKFLDLSFEYIPCGGASNVKEFAEKFEPKENQMIFCFFDGDQAGVNSMKDLKVAPELSNEKDFLRVFGKARKKNNTWYSFYPPYKRKNIINNFNIEDYFTCQLFRKYIFNFNSLDTIKGKDGLKHKLDEDCKKGIIDEKYYKKFSTLFEHIRAIKEAERSGKTVL